LNNRVINIITNRNIDSKRTCNILSTKLKNKGFIVPKYYSDEAELNICIGGDGAFLRAVHRHKFPSIPFVGINTGHLGFFQEISPDYLDVFIQKYLNKEYFLEEISLLEAEVCTKTSCINLIGINEIVIKGIDSKVVHLDIFINNNHLEKFSGDGIIIATPVGSTAYNFSSGGSIVYPTLKTIQITPLSPISSKAYRSLPNSIIIPGDMLIKIKPEYRYENSVLMVVDGIQYKYDDIENIGLTISDMTISRISFDENMYWDNLKSKFL
jgi:NAD+ kinase